MDIFDFSIFIFIITLFVIILLYLYLDRRFSYWAKRGVPHVSPPSWIFGSAKSLFFEKECSVIVYDDIYRQFEGKPYCGFYEFHYPILLLRDPQLVQEALTAKFNAFHDNKFGYGINPRTDDLLNLNPFVLKGLRWKEIRSVLIPGLTLNRIRVLNEIVPVVFKKLSKSLETNDGDIEVFDLTTKYAGEVVVNFGWGVSGDGFLENTFVKNMFENFKFITSGFTLMFINPFLTYWLNIKLFHEEFSNFLKHITSHCVNVIENGKSNQQTFLQIVLSAREKLRLNGKDMSLTEISSHMSTLFLDGYETTARTISHIIYCLMINQDVQQRLREEINNATEEISVDSVNKLQYMNMVILEATRLFPVVANITRICTEKCKLGDLEVEVGTRILVPSYSIQHDPVHYPDPESFNPENFSEENKENRHKYTHFLFGQGPRICMGVKYATASIKLFLFYLLREYEVHPPLDHHVKPLKPDPTGTFLFWSKDQIHIRLKKI